MKGAATARPDASSRQRAATQSTTARRYMYTPTRSNASIVPQPSGAEVPTNTSLLRDSKQNETKAKSAHQLYQERLASARRARSLTAVADSSLMRSLANEKQHTVDGALSLEGHLAAVSISSAANDAKEQQQGGALRPVRRTGGIWTRAPLAHLVAQASSESRPSTADLQGTLPRFTFADATAQVAPTPASTPVAQAIVTAAQPAGRAMREQASMDPTAAATVGASSHHTPMNFCDPRGSVTSPPSPPSRANIAAGGYVVLAQQAPRTRAHTYQPLTSSGSPSSSPSSGASDSSYEFSSSASPPPVSSPQYRRDQARARLLSNTRQASIDAERASSTSMTPAPPAWPPIGQVSVMMLPTMPMSIPTVADELNADAEWRTLDAMACTRAGRPRRASSVFTFEYSPVAKVPSIAKAARMHGCLLVERDQWRTQ